MAKIEDLIAQIPDERLRKGIAAEVKVVKKTKKFGLGYCQLNGMKPKWRRFAESWRHTSGTHDVLPNLERLST